MSWTDTPVKDIALGIYDGPHATPKPADSGPVFLGIKNISPEGRLDLNSVRHIAPGEFPRWTKRVQPRKDDIVFSYEATLHRYALIPDGFVGCLGRRLALVRPNTDVVDPQFLHYYFLSPRWFQTVGSVITTGSTVERIRLLPFPDLPVAVPDLDVQRRIARVLSSYDGLIENNRRRIALLEGAAGQLYKEWFVRLRFPGHEHTRITNGVPDGWHELTLKDVCEQPDGIQTGPFGSQLHQSDYTPEGTPVVMPKNIINARISLDDIARVPDAICDRLPRHKMKLGDIVYGRRGDIGRRAYIGRRQTGWMCGTGCMRLRPSPKEIAPRFLCDQLGRPEMIALITSRATGGTMLNLNGKIMSGIPIVRPPDDLQHDYVDRVEPMYALIESLGEQNQKLAEARDLLLPRLISGEVEV